ncbi:hypothetical protein LLG34_05885 [bacterium]|nr:hypothetical protein [bacterium]
MQLIRTYIFFIIIIFLQEEVLAQDMELVGKIDLQDPSFEQNLNAVSLNLYFNNKKKFKSIVGYEFNEIIKKKSSSLENEKLENLIFIAYSQDGSSQKFFYSDVSSNISKIPVFIAFREKIIIKDTVRLKNFNNKITQKDAKQLDKLSTYLKLYKIYLQFNSIPQEDSARIFSNYFLIFPQDQTVKRWIGNLSYIEIYKLKK